MAAVSIAESLSSAAARIAAHSLSPQLDAEVLLGNLLGLSRTELIVRGTAPMASDASSAYEAMVARRIGGDPVAYLTGMREFWSLTLKVTPAVLVPRPDTEMLVEHALTLIPKNRAFSVLDLGTGSGAIALAIASERPRARIVGSDVSEAALEVAEHNARALKLNHIEWRAGSWFQPVGGERFDLIVSNPPYIPAADPALDALGAEPRLALTPGPSGLEAFEVIIAGAGAHLTAHGMLAFEHGSTQSADLARLLKPHGFAGVRTHADYSGHPRVTLGTLHSAHQEPS
jgi:release factor glutamine methyltransferase